MLLGNRSWLEENGLGLSAEQEAGVATLERTGHTVVLAALAEARVLGPAGGLSLAGEKLMWCAHIAAVAQRTSPESS